MKISYCIAAAALGALFTFTGAQAAEHYYLQTGSDLQKVCANPANAKTITPAERERLLICGSYIQGYLAHYGLVRKDLKTQTFCLPASGTSGEKVRVLFLALLQQKPQIRDLPASVDLATSLAWGYSCKKTAAPAKPAQAK
ncbi:MAG TPA: Rap1a/Tai family immunity protein [Parvibaculum sp.]